MSKHMGLYAHFYQIIQKKANIEEQNDLFFTTDCPVLWRVCKDFIATIEIDCYVYRNNQFLYDFRNRKENKKLHLFYLKNYGNFLSKKYAINDYDFEVMQSQLQAVKKVNIGFIAAKNIGCDVKMSFLFPNLPITSKYFATQKQLDKAKKYLSVERKNFVSEVYPNFDWKEGKSLITCEI